MSESSNDVPSPIYVDLASESDDPVVTQIESLCLQCEGTGLTKLLMTRIPHYREVILSSFECENCGNRNNGIQSGTTQDMGVNYTLKVTKLQDLSRQIVTSEHASFRVPLLDFEIPPNRDRGEVTNIEGIIKRTVSNLEQNQPERKEMQPDVADQLDDFIVKLNHLLELNDDFNVIINDPSGNSFVENPYAPETDPCLVMKMYERTSQQNDDLGITVSEETSNLKNKLNSVEEEDGEEEEEDLDLKNEVLQFSSLCERCSRPIQTNMKVVNIPNFKEVIIMATCCSHCGFRSNEVKSGSGIATLARKMSLKITNSSLDMCRDVLKSDTCSIEIPDLDIYVGAGILGGKFTTVEGLLTNIRDDLGRNPFLTGDSTDNDTRSKIDTLISDIDKVMSGELAVTLVLDDPAGNSYLQNVYAPDDDPELTVIEYERTHEQNEDLGLNDMKTENYTE